MLTLYHGLSTARQTSERLDQRHGCDGSMGFTSASTWDDVLFEDGVDEAGVCHDPLHVCNGLAHLVFDASLDESLSS